MSAKKKKRAAVQEGTWFAVPLRSRGYVAGLVARRSRRAGPILAYFFAPVLDEPPSREQMEGLHPGGAAKVLMVADLSIVEGKWPTIGKDPSWRRELWPVPRFVRRDPLSGRSWAVQYADEDISVVVSKGRIDVDDDELERDSLLGAESLELFLTELMSPYHTKTS